MTGVKPQPEKVHAILTITPSKQVQKWPYQSHQSQEDQEKGMALGQGTSKCV
jgi:hypothetical protein